MEKKQIKSYEDLDVYQKLLQLHLDVHELTMTFPKFEMYELGSQLRRSSNSIPANIAEGWNNKHINIYLEGINRAFGELQETRHHLTAASKKKYLPDQLFQSLLSRYEECARMLRGLENALVRQREK
jgi:four helix bundle protein